MRGGILGERWRGLESGGGGELGLVGVWRGGDLCRLRGGWKSWMGRRDCESMDRESGHHGAFHLHRTWHQLMSKLARECD
jgi:hypothetical protein